MDYSPQQVSLIRRAELDPETDCLVWQGATSGDGNPVIVRGNVPLQARRVVYESFRGPLPPTKKVTMYCRNKLCINWLHMKVRLTIKKQRHQITDPEREMATKLMAQGTSRWRVRQIFGSTCC